MRKNLFLTCALALFAIVGVSAQNWCRTLATGTAGEPLENNQYRAETALIENAGAKGVRYTVMQTGSTNQIKGGGPTFALGEMIVLDAAGDTIGYTVTSNADHNTMGGAGNDGAGMPALNDGDISTYFHSTWSAAAPDEFHYIELTFEKTIDAFQLIWYTRPVNAGNRPLVIGLTNPGVTFTEDMLFAEYEFELGEQVTDASELAAGGAFTLFADAEEDLSAYGDYTSNGSTFINLSGYTTGQSTTAGPQHIVQFIPTENGTYILYQPVGATYYCDPNRWQDGYNGKNGWLRAYAGAQYLDEFEIERRADGDFEITTEIYRQWVDGAWVNYDEPIKVWVGYDPRGNLKIFPENVKEGLEQGDYTLGFGLPVDFGFTINKAHVNEEVVPSKTIDGVSVEYNATIIKLATQYKEEYAEYSIYDGNAVASIDDAIAAANSVTDLQGAFVAKENLLQAIARLVATKTGYYSERHEMLASWVEDVAELPYDNSDLGKYTEESLSILARIGSLIENVDASNMSYEAIEDLYSEIETLIWEFKQSKLQATLSPDVVSDIPADNFPYGEFPNNAVWEKSVNLVNKVNGIRLTFLDTYIGSAGGGGKYGDYPMVALGEFKLYDANGNEVALTAANFKANYTETNEGFESTVARLCDGNFGAQGYYHSPWSGSEPQEYIYLDVTFPEAMDAFKFEVYSRDKSTSSGSISLFPKKVAITKVGESVPSNVSTSKVTYIVDGEEYSSLDVFHGSALPTIEPPFKFGKSAQWIVPIDIASNADAMLYSNAPCKVTTWGDQFDGWHVLFDDDTETIFHSDYSGDDSEDGLDHYLRVDMGESKSVTDFVFTYTNRSKNCSVNAPKTIVVEGANEADGEYTQIAVLENLSNINSYVYTSPILGNGNAYRYIRYRVTETHSNQEAGEHPFFFISEFGMYDCNIPESMPDKDITLEAVYCSVNYGGIYYNRIDEDEVEVTYSQNGDGGKYTGNIVIPSTITVKDKVYSVTAIGNNAFYGCTALASIVIPNSVTSIGSDAFNGCSALADATIPNSVTIIGNHAFYNCSVLAGVTIPNSVTIIGNHAFHGCSALTSVAIPSSVTSLGIAVFSICSSLESITVAEGNTVYDSRGGCNAIIETATNTLIEGCMNTVIPVNVTSIGEAAFEGVSALASIAIPSSVTNIENYAFNKCTGLVGVEIPSSVTSIGDWAFNDCENLVTFAVYNDAPCTLGYVNFNVNGDMTLYVPTGAKAAYESAGTWNEISNIVEMPTITYMVDGAVYAVVNKAPGFAIKAIEAPEKEHRTFVAWNNLPTVMPEEDVVATAVYDVYEVVVSINQYGSSTYCSPYALDFSDIDGLKAYAATGYNNISGVVTVTRVNTAEGGSGLFIKGTPNTSFVVPVLESTGDRSLNMLVGTLAKTTVNATDGIYANYKYTILSGTTTPMFYRFTDNSSLSAGKAYLQIPLSWLSSEPAKSISIRFDEGETTDIDEIAGQRGEEEVYDLQGRKVEKPAKGLYIVNGKKKFIK